MTPPTDGNSIPTNIADLMVAVGRIEQAVKPLEHYETRITTVENRTVAAEAERARLELKIKEVEQELYATKKELAEVKAEYQKGLVEADAAIDKLWATRKKPVTFGNVITIIAASVAIIVGLSSVQANRDARTEQQIQIQMLQKNQQELMAKSAAEQSK